MSDEHTVSDDVHTTIDERFTLITNHYKNYSLSLAAAEIHELAQYANEYLSAPERAPWNKELDEATQTQTLIDVAAMIDVIITRYRPIMPTACDRARQMLDS
jgi:methionyl-tRNA synthetase